MHSAAPTVSQLALLLLWTLISRIGSWAQKRFIIEHINQQIFIMRFYSCVSFLLSLCLWVFYRLDHRRYYTGDDCTRLLSGLLCNWACLRFFDFIFYLISLLADKVAFLTFYCWMITICAEAADSLTIVWCA